jgi:hypothetical protein
MKAVRSRPQSYLVETGYSVYHFCDRNAHEQTVDGDGRLLCDVHGS